MSIASFITTFFMMSMVMRMAGLPRFVLPMLAAAPIK